MTLKRDSTVFYRFWSSMQAQLNLTSMFPRSLLLSLHVITIHFNVSFQARRPSLFHGIYTEWMLKLETWMSTLLHPARKCYSNSNRLLRFYSRCAEPSSCGGGDLPRRAADEEVQTESCVWSSAVLRHLLPGIPALASAVWHQVWQHPCGWAHCVVQRVSAVIGVPKHIEKS